MVFSQGESDNYCRRFLVEHLLVLEHCNNGSCVWLIYTFFIFYSTLMAGILPFGAVFIELFFILTVSWLPLFKYVFLVIYLEDKKFTSFAF